MTRSPATGFEAPRTETVEPAGAAAAQPTPGLPPSRPRLLPEGNAARFALLAVLFFTLLRGILFGVTVPAFWGADEDYHFLYAESLVTQQALPSPDRPLYSREYSELADVIRYDDYGTGPRTVFSGDPKASLDYMAGLPDGARDQTAIGRGVGVVHPPLYQLTAAVADAAAGDAPIQTRLTWMRVVSAAFGVLAVYMGWLLASQVLSRVRSQLLVAFLVALQPMAAFLSGIVNHDMALIAFFSGAIALMLFALRTQPRPKQGLWLGALIALALMVKGSALALLPLAALTYLAQGLVHREHWREAAKAALIAFGVVAVVAGWWYVRSRIVYGSATGAVAGSGAPIASPPVSIGQLLSWAKEWTALTYRTYWFHFVYFDAPRDSIWYFVPAAAGAIGALGLVPVAWQERRRLLDTEHPLLRQMLLMLAAILALYLSFLAVDLQRRSDGAGFYVNGGRYLLPAYAAAATLFVLGLRRLARGPVRASLLIGAGVLAAVFGVRVYVENYLHRYFGEEGLGELLRRLSFDRPEFVTPTTLWLLLALMVASVLAFLVLLARSERSGARAR